MTREDPLVGKQLANFKILRLLGSGGMARVYYGLDVTLQRPVAIKVIHEHFRRRKAYIERFLSEARLVASWRHKNIAQIYYADDDDGLFYFIMEYIDGMDLKQILAGYAAEGELMSHDDVMLVGRGAAEALDYAHERGVVHRDVKPANVIIDRSGNVYLTDFGLAVDVDRDTLEQVFGTAHYISPEQARSSSAVQPQSDIYSLGVMLYEMLTGVVPFDDSSPLVVAMNHLNRAPPRPRSVNPNLSATTEAILRKALEKDPRERFQRAGDLLDHLEDALTSRRGGAAPLLPLPPIPSTVQRAGSTNISQKSIADRIATRPKDPLTTPRLARETRPLPGPQPRKVLGVPWTWWGIGSILLLLFAALVAGIFLPPDDRRLPLAVALDTATATLLPATSTLVEPPAATSTQASTAVPTLVPTGLPTQTQPAPTSTIAFPGGELFQLIYDQTSFYLFNASLEPRLIRPIAFQRIGGTSSNQFDGNEWARYNTIIRPDTCMTITINEFEEHLHPERCRRIYEAIRTAPVGDAFIFWTPQAGSTHFRVLWDGQEIGRCEIQAGECALFLPPENGE